MQQTPKITLLGAETGRVKAISEPLTAYKLDATGQEADPIAARFVYVPPRIEHMCGALAAWYVSKLMGANATPQAIEEEKQLLLVSYALRRDDGQFRQHVFAFPAVLDKDGVTFRPDDDLFLLVRDSEIHTAAIEAERLFVDYLSFKQTQFPDVATSANLAALLEDAKKKSLLTLLSEQGYWRVIRLARGLVRAMAASASGSGGAG